MDRTISKKGLVKQELVLLFPFVKEPWKDFVLSEIKLLTQKRSHQYVYTTLKKYVELGLLLEIRKGNTNIYKLNPENRALHYLSLAEYILAEQRRDLPFENLQLIVQKIKNPFFILLIGGSYAIGKQKPTSDIDLAFIIPDSEQKKTYQLALKQGELLVPEVHGYVFTYSEFYEMLTNDEFNYGKELARKHLLYFGAEHYYSLLFQAMKHGFKG